MEHGFDLPVTYRGEERSFEARLMMTAYTSKFQVLIDGHPFTFEKDDAQQFRMIDEAHEEALRSVPRDLIEAVVRSLEAIS